MMHRNLDRRVETLVRLKDPEHIASVNDLFDLAFDPKTSVWDLHPDGTWARRTNAPDGSPLREYQESLVARQGKWIDP